MSTERVLESTSSLHGATLSKQVLERSWVGYPNLQDTSDILLPLVRATLLGKNNSGGGQVVSTECDRKP